ncbi:MAG: Lrp/AsnC family transcriptional regulator [Candidatus Diapherotrites archaeon]|uniref:Lrp/AsnC family transcriptional regulator n=1 Tax=Candidatus Iainarchaeum sp. TaxID=3101447 RepID=A0A8T4KST0_9ARCH|nr:Lrp/AsnC family transcriptional regulator [Candidatus Diapherotrites archaeon]
MAGKIDETDKRILNEMIKNHTARHSTLAKKMRLSSAAIHKRVTPRIDLRKLGFDLSVLIFIAMSKGKVEEFWNKYSEHPNICSIYNISGKYDVVLVGKFHNTERLDEFVNRIVKEDFVESTNTSLIFKTIRENFSPYPLV